MAPMTSVVVAQRNPLYLSALAGAVQRCDDLELLGSARLCEETFELVQSRRPDVAVIGSLVGHRDERDILDTIARASAFSRVVCVVSHVDVDLAMEALAAGAEGCVSTDADPDEVCKVIVASGRGEMILPSEIQDTLVQRLRRAPEPPAPRLTARELQVLNLAAEGLTAAQMAQRLSVSAATVKTHLHHVYDKLGAEGRAGAVAEALRRGLVT
jgi:two-component system, NarL family, nitrate/nitrite response regulator NarL